jgi:hypothetical protein
MDKQNNQLATTDEVTERIAAMLDGIWNALSAQPEVQAALVDIWPEVKTLGLAVRNLEGLLASALQVADDLRLQRDMAIQEVDWNKRRRSAGVIDEMARYIAYDAKIPQKDVARVLNMLLGEIDLPVSGYTLQDFFEAFKTLADEAFVEEKIQEALEAED